MYNIFEIYRNKFSFYFPMFHVFRSCDVKDWKKFNRETGKTPSDYDITRSSFWADINMLHERMGLMDLSVSFLQVSVDVAGAFVIFLARS